LTSGIIATIGDYFSHRGLLLTLGIVADTGDYCRYRGYC